METAIVGTGSIARRLATILVAGGERVVVGGRAKADADAITAGLPDRARSAGIADAIVAADAVIFAVWFDALQELLVEHASHLAGKVIVDPSNAIAPDGKGGFVPVLPAGTSAGAVIAALAPSDAHYVKTFGTLAADSLERGARRDPRAVIFYATDDAIAEATARRLIVAAGFDPVRAGGVASAQRIEVFGDLHEMGGLGEFVDVATAEAAVRAHA